MSWLGGGMKVGDHVKAREELSGGFFTARVARGKAGIVRDLHPGFWRSYATVEFENLCVRQVPTHQLRTTCGHGEDAWRRRLEYRRGLKLGLLMLNLPLLIALVKYFLGGGTIDGLAPAATEAALNLAGAVLSTPALLGVAAVVLLAARLRRR